MRFSRCNDSSPPLALSDDDGCYIDPISIDPPPFSSTPDLSPNLGNRSSSDAHIDIYHDEFALRLHHLLLVVARERRCSEHDDDSMPIADDSASDYIETSYSQKDYELKNGISPKYLTLSPSPTLYSPSALASPLDLSQEYKNSVPSDSEIDTLVFASPSCSPPARILKRPRSHSINEHHLRPNRKLPRIGSSSTPTPTTNIVSYRIIKTPSTFLNQRRFRQGPQHEALSQERPTKIPRFKTNHDTSSVYKMGRNFAMGPASLRRAASLRSDADAESGDEVSHPMHTPILQAQADRFLVPTLPSTPDTQILPEHDHPPRTHGRRLARVRAPSLSPVPIIAPPVDHMPSPPLSDEASAKIRLGRLLEREKRTREADGLDGSISKKTDDYRNDDGDMPHTSDDWELVLGVGQPLRREVVRWILEVLPVYTPTCSRSSSCSSSCSPSSFSSSSSSDSSISISPDPAIEFDLLDQLSTSPETRFHAAYMFLRYFYLIFGGCSYKNSGGLFQRQKLEEREAGGGRLSKAPDGWELVTRDVGVACLALSVKYHRDFLYPLLPVYACEFQTLAPHSLSYEDLETSQREIFAAFSYCLGTTPQAYLDEIWVALPSLRQLFDYKGGWDCVTKETWWRLFEAVLEPDVLRFPISLLTAAALTEGIRAELVRKYEFEAEWSAEMARRRGRCRPRRVEAERGKKRERRAEWQAIGVVQDVQAVLRVSDVGLLECRRWLVGVLD